MASRAIWSGSITFGMVVVPVQLYATTEGKDAVSFSQVRRKDGSQIRYKRIAEADGEEVAYADIAKAYQYGDQKVIFTDDDMASLPLSTSKQIGVEHFCSADEIDPILHGKSYYVIPASDASAHAYKLLASQMFEANKVAVAKVALRQRESVAMVQARYVNAATPVLVLTLLSWPEEVREAPHFFVGDTKYAERKMARDLIDTMTKDFDTSEHTDNYRAAVEAKAAAKAAGTATEQAPAAQQQDQAMSLMDTLAAAVQAAKAQKAK